MLLKWIRVTVLASLAAAVAFGSYYVYREVQREEERRVVKQRLVQLNSALHQYHDKHGSFPPAYFANERGEPTHSWRVILLPFLDEERLYRQYNFSQRFDSPDNRRVTAQMPSVFADPGVPDAGITTYRAIVGSQTMWPGPHASRIDNIRDGTSNTIMFVRSPTGVPWTSPTDLSLAEWAGPDSRVTENPDSGDSLLGAFADGAVRNLGTFKDRKLRHALATAMTSKIHPALKGKPLPGELVVEAEGRLNFAPLPTTDVRAVTSAPILAGRNAVYCATYSLVWQELLSKGYDYKTQLRPSPVIDELVREPFPKADLDASGYFAAAFRIDPKLNNRNAVAAAFKARYPESNVTTTTLPEDFEGWHTFAYLSKKLRFEVNFGTQEVPLLFEHTGGKKPVRSFGVYDEPRAANAGPREYLKQAEVLHYGGEKEVVVELKTKQGDRILLGMFPTPKTLQEAWAETNRRIAIPSKRKELREGETVLIPEIGFATMKKFDEFRPANDNRILVAEMGVRFALDRSGAELESFSETIDNVGNGHDHEPEFRHIWFDKPFLVALLEKNAKQPYFLLWLGNADLMVAKEPKP